MPPSSAEHKPLTLGGADSAQSVADNVARVDRVMDSASALTQRNDASADHDRTRFDRVAILSHALPADFGDYRLIRKIGEGGMGVVYEAEQKSLGNRRLALKTIKYVGDVEDRALRRFSNEVHAVAQLEHRHIVPVFHVGEEAGIHYYVMKYIEGDNLRQLIRSLRSAVSQRAPSTKRPEQTLKETPDHADSTHKSGWSRDDTLASKDVLEKISKEGTTANPLFVKNVVRMAIQIATALHHVHEQGVVHRDIKPANLLLDVEGDVWLTDFGLARIRDTPALTAPGDLVGTYHYMSPEQAMGSKRVIVDHRTDIYSLGVTLYELLTLKRAFPGSTREEILRNVQFEKPMPMRLLAPGVPVDLETIVMRAMAKDPNARFQSAAELAAELRRFRDGKPLTIRPPSLLEKFGYWARANRQLVAMLAAVTAVTFVAAIVTAVLAFQLLAQTKVSLESEKAQKEEVQRHLERSEGLRLAANSALEVESDPTLGLLLATEAAKRHPGAHANDAITRAMNIGHEARVLVGHNASVGHVSFNHDGTKIVSSAHEEEFVNGNEPAIVWDSGTGKLLGRLNGDKSITSSVFSPDRFRILTASSPPEDKATNDRDDSLLAAEPGLWDAITFQRLVAFKEAFLFKADSRAFSPDGRRIVLPTLGNKAATYDCVAGGKLVEFSGHEARVVFAAFNPRGDQVVTRSDDNTVRVWDAASGREILKLDHWRKPGAVQQARDLEWVEYSPDSRRLVTGSNSRNVEFWDLERNGEPISEQHLPGTRGLFFGNGDLLATYDLPSTNLVIASAYDAERIDELQPADRWIRKAVVSPDSRVVGMLDDSNTRKLYLWDLDRREMRAVLGGSAVIHDLAISPDSKLVATATHDKKVHLWYVASGRDRATFPASANMLFPAFAVSPDGASFSAVASSLPAAVGAMCDFEQLNPSMMLDAEISIPDPRAQRFLATRRGRLAVHSIDDGSYLGLEAFLVRDVQQAAINLDGDRVAAFAGDQQILLWKPDENRRLTLSVGPASVNELCFNPAGDQLFAVSDDNMIRVWDADSGRLIGSTSNDGRILHIEFSPDAKRFAVTTSRDEATLYDANTRGELGRFRAAGFRFDRVKFSSDGKRLLTFGEFESDSVVLWDIETRAPVAKLEIGGKVGVAMDPSQPEALVWSNQDDAVIWRYEENERLPVTDERMSGGAYSSDGEHFYLASWVPAAYEATKLRDWPEGIGPPRLTRWRRNGIERQQEIDFSSDAIRQVFVTDEDQVFVNAYRWNQLGNYHVTSHAPISIIAGHYGPISACFFTADSNRLVTTSWDGNVSVWSVSDGRLISRRNDHQSSILTAAMSRDGVNLVTGARDGTCLIWNLVDNSVSEPVALGNSPIQHVAFDGDAKRVMAISQDHRAHIFRRDSGELLTVDLHADSIEWAELAPDGASVLILPWAEEKEEQPKTLLIVPLDGAAVTRFQYPAAVLSAHFDRSSQRIVVTTRDGLVSIQNARSGRVEQQFVHEPISVHAAVFDPSGEFVYVIGFDAGTVWQVSDDRRWMSVEDRLVDFRRRHSHDPFALGDPRRLFTRRIDTYEYRDWYVQPLQAAMDQLPRSLSEPEKKRFLIED